MIPSGVPISARLFLAVAGAALVGGLGLAAPVAAHVPVGPTEATRNGAARGSVPVPSERHLPGEVPSAPHTLGVVPLARHTDPPIALGTLPKDTDQRAATGGTGTGSRRSGAIVAMVVALISVIVGGLALARSAGRIGTGNGRRGALVAEAVGLAGLVLGGWHAAHSAGGFGTGNGRAGAIVAMVMALVGMALGGLALARARRTG